MVHTVFPSMHAFRTPFVFSLATLLFALSARAEAPVFSLNFEEEIQGAPSPGLEIVEDSANGVRVEILNGERVEGRQGRGLRFNGKPVSEDGTLVIVPKTSGAVDPMTPVLEGPFTIEFWIRFDEDCNPEGAFELVNKSHSSTGPGIRWYYTWKIINFLTGDGEESSTRFAGTDRYRSPVALGEWLHLAVTRDDSGAVRMYLNGEEAAASDGDFQITPSTQPLTFGAYGNVYPFKGVMDEIKIYNRARSPEEIKKSGEAPSTPLAMQFDGSPDEDFWSDAAAYGDFRIMDSGAAPHKQTRVRVKHDDENLYLAVEADESDPAKLVVKAVEDKLADVYLDDSVEIMLETDGNTEDFYHLLFNASGRKAQERRVQTGFIGDSWFNSAWDVRTQTANGKWTAEVIVPWAMLTREEGLKDTIGLNVVRNRRAVTPHEISSLAGGAINQPGRFLRHSVLPMDTGRYQVQIGAPLLDRIAQSPEGETLMAKIVVPLKNHAANPAYFELQAALQAEAGEPSGKGEKRITLQPGESVEEVLEIPVGEPGEKMLRLGLRGASGPAALDFFPITAEFVPIQLRVLTPSYRNTFFASQDLAPVEVRLRIGLAADQRDGAVAITKLVDSKGRVITQAEPTPASGELVQTLPLESLPEGAYTVQTRLEKGGKILAEASAPLLRLPSTTGSEVYVDDQRRVMLNGKPWLPSIMASNTFEGVETTGANAVLTSVFEPAILDSLQNDGLHAVVALVTGAEIYAHIIGKKAYDPALRQVIEERVNKLKGHPNLLAWFTFDEPDSFCHPALAREIYQHIAELDPYHPTIVLNNTVRGVQEFATAADILTPDPYILPQNGGTMLRGFPYFEAFMKACAEVDDGTKAYGACVQAFNYAQYGQFNGRAPTFVEQRCQDFLNFILGAKVIYFYKFSHFDHSADLSVGVPAILSEINLLAPVILAGKPSPVVCSDDGIKYLALEKDGQLYVIACNPTTRRIEASFSVPGDFTQLHVLSENRVIPLANGKAADVFEPYATHLYVTDAAVRSPILLSEVEKQIKAKGGLYFEQPAAHDSPATR